MNKKIKSYTDLKKEIGPLVRSFKSQKELVTNIKIYLNKVTGKELLNKIEIEDLIASELIQMCSEKRINLSKNKELTSMFHSLRLNTELLYSADSEESIVKPFAEIIYSYSLRKFPMDVLKNCKVFDIYIEDKNIKISELYKRVFNDHPEFKKLFFFVVENQDVSGLLNKYIYEMKQKFIVELIIHDIISINAIFIYFDKKKDIKENTEYFYGLLRKKISRQNIQSTLTREKEKIKQGKYSVPNLVL